MYVPQLNRSNIGGVINPIKKLLICQLEGISGSGGISWRERRNTQFEAVLSPTPLARNRVGNISEGIVHAIGPQLTPYERVKKSSIRYTSN